MKNIKSLNWTYYKEHILQNCQNYVNMFKNMPRAGGTQYYHKLPHPPCQIRIESDLTFSGHSNLEIEILSVKSISSKIEEFVRKSMSLSIWVLKLRKICCTSSGKRGDWGGQECLARPISFNWPLNEAICSK